MTGTRMTHVPYTGMVLAQNDLIGGQIQVIFGNLPDMKERLAGDGLDPVGGSPERFHEVLKRDIAKWQKVVKVAAIKPEN